MASDFESISGRGVWATCLHTEGCQSQTECYIDQVCRLRTQAEEKVRTYQNPRDAIRSGPWLDPPTCNICGCVVSDPDKHAAWHQAQRDVASYLAQLAGVSEVPGIEEL